MMSFIKVAIVLAFAVPVFILLVSPAARRAVGKWWKGFGERQAKRQQKFYEDTHHDCYLQANKMFEDQRLNANDSVSKYVRSVRAARARLETYHTNAAKLMEARNDKNELAIYFGEMIVLEDIKNYSAALSFAISDRNDVQGHLQLLAISASWTPPQKSLDKLPEQHQMNWTGLATEIHHLRMTIIELMEMNQVPSTDPEFVALCGECDKVSSSQTKHDADAYSVLSTPDYDRDWHC